MNQILFVMALLTGTSVFADGKASVLTNQDASVFPPKFSCVLLYNNSTMSVGQVLQLLETNPALSKSLKKILGVQNGKVDAAVIQKATAYQQAKNLKVADCSNAKINDVFEDAADFKSCSALQTLTDEMNKIPIANENSNFSDRCRVSTPAAELSKSVPSAK